MMAGHGRLLRAPPALRLRESAGPLPLWLLLLLLLLLLLGQQGHLLLLLGQLRLARLSRRRARSPYFCLYCLYRPASPCPCLQQQRWPPQVLLQRGLRPLEVAPPPWAALLVMTQSTSPSAPPG